MYTFPTVESLYIILEYCAFGRLKDYLGLPVKLSDYSSGSVHGSDSGFSMGYVNILQSTSYNSYSKFLTKDNSLLNMQSDSGYGDSIVYAPESVDSGYSVGESVMSTSRDYANSPGILYDQDITNFALQIAHGLQHLENLKVFCAHTYKSFWHYILCCRFIMEICQLVIFSLPKDSY